MRKAINDATNAKIAVIAASGNDAMRNGIGSPACISNAISVGAVYDGNKKKLIPGYWKYELIGSKDDVINDNRSDIRKLKNLLEANHSVKTTAVLLSEMVTNASELIQEQIENYNPEE